MSNPYVSTTRHRDVRKLLCIDISGVMVRPEPFGNGYQAHVEGDSTFCTRGASEDEAVGALIRRLAVEHEGANWRRQQKEEQKSTRCDVQTAIELQKREEWSDELKLAHGLSRIYGWNYSHAREIAELAWVELYAEKEGE